MKEKILELLKKLHAKAHIDKQDIKVEFVVRVNEWATSYWGPEKVIENLMINLEHRIQSAIQERFVNDIDAIVVQEIAKELAANYDFKKAVNDVMLERIQSFLKKDGFK